MQARPIDIVLVSLGGNDVGLPFDAKDSLDVVDDEFNGIDTING
jgi:hypothetical protein